MGVVCETRTDARCLRDFSDDVHTALLNDRDLPKELTSSAKSMIGVVTLENLIERVLGQDINDELDREKALRRLRAKNEPTQVINQQAIIKSMEHRYDNQADTDTPTQATESNEDAGFYSSQFAEKIISETTK